MASLSSAVITAPSLFRPARAVASSSSSSRPSFAVRASLGRAAGTAAVAVAASALLATGAAMAQDVLLGASGGALVFEPNEFSVKAGDTITFKNNAGFPHNIVFDEDAVPSGVDAEKISQSEYLNAQDETYSVTLTVPGTYEFYCEPHQGAGMVGKVTVN